MGLLSHIFDRAEILTEQNTFLRWLTGLVLKYSNILENYSSLGKVFHRLIDFFSDSKNIICSVSWYVEIRIFVQMVFYDQFYIIVCNYALNTLLGISALLVFILNKAICYIEKYI